MRGHVQCAFSGLVHLYALHTMHAFCRSRPKNLPTGNGRNVSWNHAAQEQDIWRDLTASGSNSNLSQMQLSKLVYGKCDFTDVHIRYQYTCAERGCTVHTTHGRYGYCNFVLSEYSCANRRRLQFQSYVQRIFFFSPAPNLLIE